MRSPQWAVHARTCADCRSAHLCEEGRKILCTRHVFTVPGVQVSQAARTEINIHNLILEGGF